MHRRHKAGFTLIEISIVLVIIGLIIGGILTGQNLIDAAATRAQITQIEKFNQAVNTFYVKYGYLPGDIPDPAASSIGLKARGTLAGQGDGNGVIQARNAYNNLNGQQAANGENAMFWVDLSAAGLINASLTSSNATSNLPCCGSKPATYFPAAALGQENYVYIWSGWSGSNLPPQVLNINLFGIEQMTSVVTGSGAINGTTGFTVQQAYAIDTKIDDGLPMSGRVLAMYDYGGCLWSAFGGAADNFRSCVHLGSSYGEGFVGLSSSCMDQNGVSAGQMLYSMSQNTNNLNCALSIEFQ